ASESLPGRAEPAPLHLDAASSPGGAEPAPLRLDAASSPEALEPAPLRLGSERSAGAADSVAARSGSASASGPLASDPSLSELESTDTLGDSTVAVAAPRRTTRSRTSPRPHESDSRRFFATWSAAWLESQPMK